MKKLLLLLSCYLLLNAKSFAQHDWQWLNPQPTGYACLKVVFTDHQTGYILNSNGDLVRTKDQGAHWEVTDNFPNASIMEIADSTGVIAANDGSVYVSSDNGKSWHPAAGIANMQFLNISIVSRDTFFLSTRPGIIYMTGNRGLSWVTLNCNNQINCIDFINSKTGFAGGTASLILKTEDGGLSWQKKLGVNYIPSAILSFQFLTADTGFAMREYNDLLVTYDAGNTWKSNDCRETVPVIDFLNPRVGYLGGSDGAIVRTDDSGATWNSVTPPNGFKDGYQIYSMDFLSIDTGFAVGLLGRILKTTDGGQNWNSYSPTHIPVTAVAFPTASVAYATTWNYAYKSIDSGHTWNVLPISVGTDYASSSRFDHAHFSNADTGFLMSSNYLLEHMTSDGGQTWTSFNPTGSLYDDAPGLFYLNPATAFLSLEETSACCSGLLLESHDGGSVWNQIWGASFNGEYFSKIFYIDDSTGYGIRYSQLYKTTDASKTWTLIYNPYNNYALRDLSFVNKQTGFLVDEQSQILVTHDAGASWQQIFYGGVHTDGITTIRFFNEQIGYFTDGNQFGPGNYGNIYKTIDGGQTWQLSKNMGGNSITFTPDSNVVVAGFGGTILKNPIRNWQVDSLLITANNNCGQNFSASVGAALSEADSIGFEITQPDGSVKILNASPATVQNGRIICSASGSGFVPGNYIARIRLKYDGKYQYSTAVKFVAQGLLKPIIRDSVNVLISSAPQGNQWYLNGQPIPGATQTQFTVLDTGYYSVQARVDSCISPFSDSVKVQPEVRLISFTALQDSACGEKLSATLDAILTEVDNISFEISSTSGGGSQSILANPDHTKNGRLTCTASVSNINPGETYLVWLRVFIAGNYSVSNSISFIAPQGAPTPSIRDSAHMLISSSPVGNQWWLDGNPVSGATQQQWTPKTSGLYTVQVSLDSCKSAMSSPFRYVANNLGVTIFPNPVIDHLTILNTQNRFLEIQVDNMTGKEVYSTISQDPQIIINTDAFVAGQYIVHIRDRNTNENANIIFIKL